MNELFFPFELLWQGREGSLSTCPQWCFCQYHGLLLEGCFLLCILTFHLCLKWAFEGKFNP